MFNKIPYKELPYINFYRYPKLSNASNKKKLILHKKLQLNSMSGPKVFTIFVMIPYCRTRCNSCPFFKAFLPTNVDQYDFINEYLNLIILQIKRYGNTKRFSRGKCGAVFIGGGTASLLAPNQVKHLVNILKNSFKFTDKTEVTLEGNPADFSEGYLRQVLNAGINRVSIGVQSSTNKILKKSINTFHDEHQSISSLRSAVKLGFKTINADLMYGLPEQTFKDWKTDIKKIITIAPESITTYRYIIHSDTVAEKLIKKGTLKPPIDLNESYRWYLYTVNKLSEHSYTEQRMGNFSKKGHEQQYSKLSYTQGVECIPIGAGSYGFINHFLFRAADDPKKFKQKIDKGLFVVGDRQAKKATSKQMMERYMINNLFSNSINDKVFTKKFGMSIWKVFKTELDEFSRYSLIRMIKNNIYVTNLGKRWMSNMQLKFYSTKLND